jgi:hypothetical protein
MESYDRSTCSARLLADGVKCGRPAGAGVGGFNGWCEEHFKKVALKVARYLGSQARDVTTKLVIAKLIKVALEHFPHIIMNRSGEPGSVPEEMVRLARLNGEGNTLAIWLHGPKDTDRFIREAEMWWKAIPAQARAAAQAWAESDTGA